MQNNLWDLVFELIAILSKTVLIESNQDVGYCTRNAG
jgi:hypothetical protein